MAAMANKYSADNETSRRKLESFLQRLSDRDLARRAPNGWTIGGLLVHLAFYDYRAVVLLQRWKSNGIAASPSDVNTVNDSLKPIANAMGPAEVRRVTVESARAVDAEVDSLDPAFLARVEAEGTAVKLNRALHREHHLQQMQGMLAAGSP
ncbi:MAG TPA: DinB family protein [Spirochaetia bacterium]|nr:DinB family protein [Spirochaetia bacterium]